MGLTDGGAVDASDDVPVTALTAQHAFNRTPRSRLGDGPPGAVAPLLTPGPHFQAMSTEPDGLDGTSPTEPRIAHLECTVTG
jgi:hypothetical protein